MKCHACFSIHVNKKPKIAHEGNLMHILCDKCWMIYCDVKYKYYLEHPELKPDPKLIDEPKPLIRGKGTLMVYFDKDKL